jgi:hypothetical protein
MSSKKKNPYLQAAKKSSPLMEASLLVRKSSKFVDSTNQEPVDDEKPKARATVDLGTTNKVIDSTNDESVDDEKPKARVYDIESEIALGIANLQELVDTMDLSRPPPLKRRVELRYKSLVDLANDSKDEASSDDDDSFLRVLNDDSGRDTTLGENDQLLVYSDFLRKLGLPDDIMKNTTLDEHQKLYEYKMKVTNIRLDILDLENQIANGRRVDIYGRGYKCVGCAGVSRFRGQDSEHHFAECPHKGDSQVMRNYLRSMAKQISTAMIPKGRAVSKIIPFVDAALVTPSKEKKRKRSRSTPIIVDSVCM